MRKPQNHQEERATTIARIVMLFSRAEETIFKMALATQMTHWTNTTSQSQFRVQRDLQADTRRHTELQSAIQQR